MIGSSKTSRPSRLFSAGGALGLVAALFSLGLTACAEDFPVDDGEADEVAVTAEESSLTAGPTVTLKMIETACTGPFFETTAIWGGTATSYDLMYNGRVIAHSTGPSSETFRPGSRHSIISVKGCKSGVCTTTTRHLDFDNECPPPPPGWEPDL